MKPGTSQYGMRLRGWLVPLTLLILAELTMRLTQVQNDALAMPSEVAAALAETVGNGSLVHATWQTLITGLSGVMMGSGLGLLVGIWFGL